MNIPDVIKNVVQNDLCIGCGICESQCPNDALTMSWNDYGFLTPELSGNCDSNGTCLSVCPFNPFPKKEVRTEDEIADIFLREPKKHNSKIGKYSELYAGHSKEFRMTSSSGGIATYVLNELLEKKIVNHVISVRESVDGKNHYEYRISSEKDELVLASKTKYYPVSLNEVIKEVEQLEGIVAVTGVACFIKAIRLAQFSNHNLKEKIGFLIGIICGGVKSRFFTEYLASKAGVEKKYIKKPEYRIKDVDSSAGDYSFGSFDNKTGDYKSIKMRSVGDMWGTGMFKANACDFCDDVMAEVADISVGDAWIPPYNKDGSGANVVVTRSLLADKIIKDGIESGDLELDIISGDKIIRSQKGSFNHRHKGLRYRIKTAKRNDKVTPPKRFDNEKVSLPFRVVQKFRARTRVKSLEYWKRAPNATDFDFKIAPFLEKLRKATRIYHYRRGIIQRLSSLKSRWSAK